MTDSEADDSVLEQRLSVSQQPKSATVKVPKTSSTQPITARIAKSIPSKSKKSKNSSATDKNRSRSPNENARHDDNELHSGPSTQSPSEDSSYVFQSLNFQYEKILLQFITTPTPFCFQK